jgi:hypothetical protein
MTVRAAMLPDGTNMKTRTAATNKERRDSLSNIFCKLGWLVQQLKQKKALGLIHAALEVRREGWKVVDPVE